MVGAEEESEKCSPYQEQGAAAFYLSRAPAGSMCSR